MTKLFRNIFTFMLAALTLTIASPMGRAQTPDAVAPNKVTVSVDSVTITMGERTTVRVEVLKNGHVGALVMPVTGGDDKPLMLGDIEVRQIQADSTELGNGRVQVNYDLLIQPFNPGDLSIAPFKLGVDGDTVTSNVVALKVLEPEMPQEMRDSLWINPMRGTLSIDSEWYDWIPDWLSDYWYWWLAGLAFVALAVLVFILYRKNGKTLLPMKKRIPPYVLATRRLEELKRKRLHEQGHAKAYYTELTDILRQYLGGRFKIYALEMTSSQIMDAMSANAETARFVDELKPMFTTADFVKFAKQDATTDENIRSFNAVNKFVLDTKPLDPEDTKPTMVRVTSSGKAKKSASHKKRKK